MLINPSELPTPQVYFTLTQTVIPRPIAWVLSENESGNFNLAPFSYFNAVSSDPPLVMFSVGLQPDGSTQKDTLQNILARPGFVINIAGCDQLDVLNQTSATLPRGESEVDAVGIELTTHEGFDLPAVAGSRIAFQCELYHHQEIGNRRQALVFGEITRIHIDDDCAEITEQGRLKVHADRIRPLSRLGASEYADFGEIMVRKRPA
jgi:flavin reductase (DIM6/NTAB) family NADH-FMN oxidoreductase RutF